MDKTTARIIKHAQQSASVGGQPMSIADIARKYKMSQSAVFALVVEEAANELDVEIGRSINGEWTAYSSIGEYLVVPAGDWSTLLYALAACEGKHYNPAANEHIAQLLYILR